MHNRLLLGTILTLLALLSTISALVAWSSDPGLRKGQIDVDGIRRTYYFHAPASKTKKDLPLVFVFHGGLGNGAKVAQQTGFNDIADRNGFAVVYPDSIDYWNDGRSTTGVSDNDTKFVSQLIDLMVKTEGVDRQRVYATGASNGGMFTLRLACEMSDKIAAFAPVIASFPVSYEAKCKPDGPVPVMMINGTLDTFIQWNGGSIHKGAKRGAGGEVIPVPETARFWREHDSCSAHPTTKQLPDIDKDDGTTVKVLSYPDCKDPGSFLWVQVVGGGHTWPGTKLRKRPFVARLMGAVSQDIDASQMIWDFFKGYRLAQSGADIK